LERVVPEKNSRLNVGGGGPRSKNEVNGDVNFSSQIVRKKKGRGPFKKKRGIIPIETIRFVLCKERVTLSQLARTDFDERRSEKKRE